MKKSIYTLAITAFAAGTIFSACNTSAEKVENAQNKVTEANEDLNKAEDNYAADVKKFRKESEEKIADNEMRIAECTASLEREKNEATQADKVKVAELEQKNRDLRKRMDNYQENGNENWQSFKREFDHDINELAISLRDISKNNVK
jgi:cell shape-determining protein MreC